MEAPYETVHVVEDWYDGPREGFANYQNKPHHYRPLHLDTSDYDAYNPDEDRFELTPVSEQAIEWATASHQLWLRWNDAYRAGTLVQDANDLRVLPEDRVQDQHLRDLLEQHRNERAVLAFIVRGKFELGCYRVQWYSLDEALTVNSTENHAASTDNSARR